MNAFTEFDSGNSGSEGPWINWGAQKEKFTLRDRDGNQDFGGFVNGIVLDVQKMKTGWCYTSGIAGQAPEWRMNPTLAKFMPTPGEDYKKGFKIRCAIGGGKTASWDQAGAGAWNAFLALIPALQQAPDGDVLPLVRMIGTKAVKFTKGSTTEPVLEIVKWVPRPDCLKEGFAAGVDTGEPAPQQAAAVTPPPAATSVPADAAF